MARTVGASASSSAPTRVAAPSPTPYKRPALQSRVLVADEAHRTAGLRRKKSAKSAHALPRRAGASATSHPLPTITPPCPPPTVSTRLLLLGSMTPTRVGLDRNKRLDCPFDGRPKRPSVSSCTARATWKPSGTAGLADYRIIAVALNGPNRLRRGHTSLPQVTESKGRHQAHPRTHFLRGLAFTLAMGGATQSGHGTAAAVPIKSCIAFMNTVDKSKNPGEGPAATHGARTRLQGLAQLSSLVWRVRRPPPTPWKHLGRHKQRLSVESTPRVG